MKADENIVHFIKAHDKEDIKLGVSLFADNIDQIFIDGKNKNQYSIIVPSQSRIGSYIVSLTVKTNTIEHSCECIIYEKYGQCKHGIAAAIYLLMDEFNYDIEKLKGLFDIEIA